MAESRGPRGRRERETPPPSPANRTKFARVSASGAPYVDFKENETLRKLTAANGKVLGRRRSGANALEQRMLASAVKRARFMALMPYQTAAQ